MTEKIAFLQVFPCCGGCAEMCGGLDKASLSTVVIEKENRSMTAAAFFAQMPAPAELKILEDTIAAEFSLSAVEIIPDYPRPEIKPAPKKEPPKDNKSRRDFRSPPAPAISGGDMLMGKSARGEIISMDSISTEGGDIVVRGRVFAVDSREISKTRRPFSLSV
ncbi:MAG: hypothetical protein IKC02_08615 [Oscillospiraceae bacterium]|nr:hypothetical protein [Oscillospiraceae bacterium]